MSTEPLRILLVEDNPGDVRLLREMLSTERPGSFEIVNLPRLGLALNHLAKGGVDIVLLDLGLPDENGLETVRRVRKLAPDVPLVVLTGRDDDATIAEAMLEGAQDYLVKGQIENRALPRALKYAIERFRLLRRAGIANLELERRVQEKDLMLSEIHHRVKNSLQVVSSLLNLEAARVQDPTVSEMLMTTQNRVRSMALIHQTLYQSKDFAQVDFHEFLQSFVPTLVQSYSIHPEEISLEFHVCEVHLPIDEAISCGLIVNELISNALKHAFPGHRGGRILVSFAQEAGQQAVLRVEDNGVGLPEGFKFDQSETLGVQLVSMLAGQLAGKVRVERECGGFGDGEGGTCFEVRFPLAVTKALRPKVHAGLPVSAGAAWGSANEANPAAW
jgi:two-component sensor histidine kinase